MNDDGSISFRTRWSRGVLVLSAVAVACVPPPPNDDGSGSAVEATPAPSVGTTGSDDPVPADVDERDGEAEVVPAFEPPAPALPGGPPQTGSDAHAPLPPKAPDKARHKVMVELGREAFEALTAGDAEHLLRLTPARKTSIQRACPAFAVADTKAIKAAFAHCHDSIDFDAIRDVRVGASAESNPKPAQGCDDDVVDLGRLQILVITTKGDWQIDLLDTFGRDDKAIGFGGGFRCKKLQDE